MKVNQLAGRMIEVYEDNYTRMLGILPEIDLVQQMNGIVCANIPGLRLKILDRAKYTTTMLFLYEIEAEAVFNINFKVRIYHDAKLAEVICFQNQSGFKASYKQPNANMYGFSEKQHINLFFNEWLSNCCSRVLKNKPINSLT